FVVFVFFRNYKKLLKKLSLVNLSTILPIYLHVIRTRSTENVEFISRVRNLYLQTRLLKAKKCLDAGTSNTLIFIFFTAVSHIAVSWAFNHNAPDANHCVAETSNLYHRTLPSRGN
ncbi:unnamed protein product, partial [Ixodes pacificus]